METPGYVAYPTSGAAMPMPPRLHWAWVLVLSVFTRNLFSVIWLVVQAVWVRKATGRTAPQTWAILHLCAFPFIFLSGLAVGVLSARSGMDTATLRNVPLGLEAVSGLAVAILYLVTIYKLRTALGEPPIGIPLGGGMTFFFGPLYFQYFLRDWMPMNYSMATPYPQYTYPSVPPTA